MSTAKTGKYITRNPDGSSLHANYKNGKLDGTQTQFYSNGVPEIQEFYRGGNLQGEYRCWYGDGSLEISCYYQDDRVVDFQFYQRKKRVFLTLKSRLYKDLYFRFFNSLLISDLSRSIYT